MQPFFSFYGGKWKLAERLGPPQRDHVIEPFAGSAGYSVYWEPKKVTLIERDPVVYGVWKFLQRASPRELMRLPSNISDVDELPNWVCKEARWLIGFWFDHGRDVPTVRRTNWARSPKQSAYFWSETIKLRLASQVDRIRHWTIIEESWEQAPDIKAHWHIDPPYYRASRRKYYRYHSIDRTALAKWCKRRRGFVQVCENDGATWLRFEPLSILYTHRARGYSVEAVYEMEN
jgi:site-specific DNA-adenine methylase